MNMNIQASRTVLGRCIKPCFPLSCHSRSTAVVRCTIRLVARRSLEQQANDSEAGKNSHHSKISRHYRRVDWQLKTIKVDDYDAPHVGFIRMLSLNAPKRRNALSRQLVAELSQQIEDIHAEGEGGQTRALLIASAVDGVFCAGADLKERAGMTLDETRDFLKSLRHTFARLEALPIPTIVAVAGHALGGGFELTLCAHIRVFSETAEVGLPETRLGIIPGAGGTYRLSALVGKAQALDLILNGSVLTGGEAYRRKLCNMLSTGLEKNPSSERLNGLSPPEWFARESRIRVTRLGLEAARHICEGGPLALRAAIQAIREGPSERAEHEAYESILHTEDRKIALEAFANKLPPHFIGR